MRGGVEPDLLEDAGWWQTRLWFYAVYALLIYARAAAERNDTTVEQIVKHIAARHQFTADLAGAARSRPTDLGNQ